MSARGQLMFDQVMHRRFVPVRHRFGFRFARTGDESSTMIHEYRDDRLMLVAVQPGESLESGQTRKNGRLDKEMRAARRVLLESRWPGADFAETPCR